MREWLQYLKHLKRAEPARLRAAWTAAVILLGSLGVSVSPGVDLRVGACLGGFAAILALLQGESTRDAVSSPKTVDQLQAQLQQLRRQSETVVDVMSPGVLSEDLIADMADRLRRYHGSPAPTTPPDGETPPQPPAF